jgi:2-keto-4-pentenoate hydratase/2-oxohepta-3-ene-1,7-dioic acid hydratase in catechol pathway
VTPLPPIERIWVVLGGFLPAEGAELPPGTVPRLIPKMVSDVSTDGGCVVARSDLAGGVAVEGELALVIGADVHRPSAAEAAGAVLGYTCFNDVSALGLLSEGEWALAKSIDTFASIGASLRTDLDDDAVMAGLAITTRVNGEERQRGDTRLYKFPPSEVVRYLATHVTLRRGDVISLGTPPPPPLVVPGDRVEIEVEGVGVLHNTIVGNES